MKKIHPFLILIITIVFIKNVSAQHYSKSGPTIENAFATVQRNGRPYKTFYNYYITPHAIEEAGKVFCAYQDGQGRPIMMAWDIRNEKWSGPVRASEHGLGADTHGNPSICIDQKGYIHLFFGCHGRAMHHVKSRQPYDITLWQNMPSPVSRATYPETIRMADGRMFLFYRAGGHMEPWSLNISSDNGRTWSKTRKIIEMRIDPVDPLAAAYCTFLPGADFKTIHCFFVHKDDHPGRRRNKPHPWRPLKYPGLHEAVYRYNVYYIRMDTDGTWRGTDGTQFDSLPISKAWADKHALVHDTGHEFASHKRVVIDRRDRPYLRFTEGVHDWKSGKIIVPLVTKYAAMIDHKWGVSDRLPDDWSQQVRQHIRTPGPAAYGKRVPNPWFIHFTEGPDGDPAKTYIWLGHVDKGYVKRNNGPAPAP